MGEQALDLRTTAVVLRRHRVALVGAALLGLAAGVSYTVVRPPLYSSTSLVLLPTPQDAQQAPADPGTQQRVAGSAAVLGPAGARLRPRMSAARVAEHVHVSAPSSTVLEFRASAATPDLAVDIAAAAAQAEVGYVKDAASSILNAQRAGLHQRETTLQNSLDAVGTQITKTTQRRTTEGPTSAAGRDDSTALAQLTAEQANLVLQLDQVKQQAQAADAGATPSTASIIQPATPARRPAAAERFGTHGAAGAGLVLMLTIFGMLLFARRDRRLRYRDQIADALGSTVVASVSARVPRSVAGWTELLAEYEPATSDAWALRQVLREVDVAEDRPRTLTLVTLAGDSAALAIGPQLASYAASTGLRTRLVAAQRHEAAAALWASCHRAQAQEEVRPGLYVGPAGRSSTTPVLTVVMVVLDRRKPELVVPTGSDLTLVGISAGTVTAEELARAAVTVDDAGIRIEGMVVANPDDLDRSTGRLPQRERAAQVQLPSRLTGASAALPGPEAATSEIATRRNR